MKNSLWKAPSPTYNLDIVVDTKTKLGPIPSNRTLLFGASDAPPQKDVTRLLVDPETPTPLRSDIEEINGTRPGIDENESWPDGVQRSELSDTRIVNDASTSNRESADSQSHFSFDPSDDEPPKVVNGKYLLKQKLGEGGMGSVWCATDLQLRRDVAIKFLNPNILNIQGVLVRFQREAEILASLRAAGIIQIFEIGLQSVRGPFIVTELLDGQSLEDRLESQGPLNIEETANVVGQVLEALEVAHEAGIIHRDIKPANVILGNGHSNDQLKLIDFGLAGLDNTQVSDLSKASIDSTRHYPPEYTVDSVTYAGPLGTPYYMSPEQCNDVSKTDARSDLWAVGVLTFQCLLGRLPYEGDSYLEIFNTIVSESAPIPSQYGLVPPGFDEWFLKSQEKDPDKRFQSAGEMARGLYAVVGRGWTLSSKYRPYPASLVTELEQLTRGRENVRDVNTAVVRQDRQRKIDQLVIQLKRTPVAGDMVADAKLVRIVGKGNYGTVWEATEAATGDVVAVKVFDSDRLGLGLHLYHFRRGVRAMRQLTESKHRPESVIALGQVEESGLAYSMTYLVDGDLANITERGWSLEKKSGYLKRSAKQLGLHTMRKCSTVTLSQQISSCTTGCPF